MTIRTVLLLMVLVAIVGFAALNWSAFMTPTTLSFGVGAVQAPLGLVMLGLLVVLTALFLVFVVYLQTSVLLEARRHAHELQASRVLADQAEASRFTDLRMFLEARLPKQSGPNSETNTAVLTKLDQLTKDIHTAIEQSEAAVAAHIGELEDRLERSPGLAPRPG